MRRVDCEQRSPEWFAARLGSLGASSVHEAVTKLRSGGYGAGRANTATRLILERLTGVTQDTYQSAAMLQGIEREPEARAAYEWEYEVDVEQVGLVLHPTIDGAHCSPDGLMVSTKCGLEIKAPEPKAHLDFLLTGKIPANYLTQCHWSIACCDFDSWDFGSYNPDFPEPMRLKVVTVKRDDAEIKRLEDEVRKFLSELDTKLDALLSQYGESGILEQRLKASVA